MAGQVWQTNDLGKYMFAPNLSKLLRTVVSTRCKFRQFADLPEDQNGAQNVGETFNWNVYTEVEVEGAVLPESTDIPETQMKIRRKSLTVKQYANSVPYTGMLDDLSEHPVKEIINKVMKLDSSKVLDKASYAQFASTPLVVEAAGGNSATAISVVENGTPTAANAIALNRAHVRKIATEMAERNIPTHDHGDYECIARPATFEPFKQDLEEIHKYVDEGYGLIRNGEIGRFEGTRFTCQTNIANKGWAAGTSDQAFFFGEDAIVEGVVVPEEIRGKFPTNYGLGKGIAWYYLGGFGIARNDADDARILRWDSTG